MKINDCGLICGIFYALCGAAVAAPEPNRVVDIDFAAGALAAAWKDDGREIAVEGAEGVAIRDAATLRLKRFLNAKALGASYFDFDSESNLPPTLVAWCGDNLVFQLPDYARGYVPGFTRLVSARDGRRLALWRARVSPDNRTLFFSDGKGRFRVLNFAARRWFDVRLPLRETNSRPAQIDPNFPPNEELWAPEITFSPDGKHAADQLGDGRMRLWNVKNAKVSAILRDKVTSMAYPAVTGPVVWSPDGRKVATLGGDPSHRNFYYEEGPNDGSVNEHPAVVKIWDARTGALLQWFSVVDSNNDARIQLDWLDNDRLFAGAKNGFQIHSVSRRKSVVAPKVKEDFRGRAPYALAPDASRLFSHNRFFFLTGERALWPSKAIFRVPARLEDLAWSRDGRFLAASFYGTANGVQAWRREAENGRFSLANLGLSPSPSHIGWTRSHRVWSSDFYRITFWNGRQNWRHEVWNAPFIGQTQKGNPSNLPPSRGLFALADDKTKLELPDGLGGEIYRWNAGASEPELLYKKAQSGSFGEVLSPDERFLCFNHNINGKTYLRIFDLRVPNRTLQLLHPPLKDAKGNGVWDLEPVFSGDGKRLAWGARLWELPSGRPLSAPARFSDGPALALNSDGTSLLRGGPNGLRFFAPLSEKPTRQIASDASGIGVAAWSPDNRFLALARRNCIEIYDVKAGTRIASLYAWPSLSNSQAIWKPQKTGSDARPDWLSLPPRGAVSGSAPARALVRVAR